MGKYTEESKRMLELIGGRENITAVSHCVTRLRFVLKDPTKADIKGIEALKSVKGSFTQAGQFQVIIGNDVANFYNDFTAVSGIEGVSKDAVKQEAKSNMSLLQRTLANLAEIFAPLIPALVVGGLILGFRNLIDAVPLLEGGTKTITSVSQFWAGVNRLPVAHRRSDIPLSACRNHMVHIKEARHYSDTRYSFRYYPCFTTAS